MLNIHTPSGALTLDPATIEGLPPHELPPCKTGSLRNYLRNYCAARSILCTLDSYRSNIG